VLQQDVRAITHAGYDITNKLSCDNPTRLFHPHPPCSLPFTRPDRGQRCAPGGCTPWRAVWARRTLQPRETFLMRLLWSDKVEFPRLAADRGRAGMLVW